MVGAFELSEGSRLRNRREISVVDPDTGAEVGSVVTAAPHEIEDMLAAAAQATQRSVVPRHKRAEALMSAADMIAADKTAFVDTLVAEGIKTLREATSEVGRSVETLRGYAVAASDPGQPPPVLDVAPCRQPVRATMEMVPAGVVVAITPFNDPVNLTAHKIGAAVAAGCPVIVKPHESTPLSGDALCQLAAWDLLGPGFVQVAHGEGPTVGAALVSDSRVRVVSFTGGRRTARKLTAIAGVKRFVLELGGNCPTLVWRDADVVGAAKALADGMVAAAGQNCLHVQRIYVHADIAGALIECLVCELSEVTLGPKNDLATDMGPQLNPRAADRVMRLIDAATEQGGEVLFGGRRFARCAVEPTLLTGLSLTHAVYQEEVFGPVTVIESVRNLDDALRRMNATELRLQAGVFTNDLRVLRQCEQALRFGAVAINQTSDVRVDAMPFGGPGLAGLGREGGRWGVAELSEPRLTLWPDNSPDGHQVIEGPQS